MLTTEQVIEHYTQEHPSPIVEYLRMTSPHNFEKYAEQSPTSDRVQQYLDKTEKVNPILQQYM